MTPLQIFLVSTLVYGLAWRIVDTLYCDPSIGYQWVVVAALLGGLLTEGFRRLYNMKETK